MAQMTAGSEHIESTGSMAAPLPFALGLFAFTTAILGSVFAGFLVPSFDAAGMSLLAAVTFFGGLIQFFIGMGEIRRDDALMGTFFAAYGTFLMMFGVMLTPFFGIHNAISSSMMGLFFLGWTIFSGILLLSMLRMSLILVVTFALFFLSYLLLTIGELAGGSATMLMIGGWLGILTALVAWYTSFAEMLKAGKSMFHLPI